MSGERSEKREARSENERRRRFLRSIVMGVFIGSTALHLPAAEPSQPPPPVQALLDQLQSDDWSSRQQAVDRLVALGEPALPHLQKLLARTTDNEVRARAAAAITRIQDQRRIGASVVSLNLKNAPASLAFTEVFRQAGARLQTDPPNLLAGAADKPVSINCDRRPFWDVMRSLCAQAGVEPASLRSGSSEIGLGLTRPNPSPDARAWDDRPITLAGPLLIRADRLTLVSSVRLKAPRAIAREFHAVFTIFAEPKLRVLDYSGVLRLDEVVDENGNSLIPADGNGVPANAEVFGSGHAGSVNRWEAGASLHYPANNRGKRIARFKATTALEVLTHSATLQLPLKDRHGNPAPDSRNVNKTIGGVRMLVKGFDPATSRCEVTVHRDGRSDPEWYRLRSLLYAGEGTLLDADGNAIARTAGGMEAEESADSERLDVRLKFERPEGGKPGPRQPTDAAKLVWEFPVETRQVVIPFEFRDLPIP